MVAAGPKRAADPSPLPLESSADGSERFADFCRQFIVTPKGTGARQPMILRPWQRQLVGSVLDVFPQPRTAGWMLPRGQGKSTLVAALGLYDLFLGQEGASVVVAATDERQARIVFGIAVRMTELSDELGSRCQVLKDHIRIPERGATFQCLPAEPKRLEGLDATLFLLDEAGVISRDVYEVLTLAQGKRERSTLLAIGTPGPDPYNSVLNDLRTYAAEHPEDRSLVWREFSAAGFEDHPVDCRHCWELSNPALGDYLHEDALVALLPPKTREATYRRARLCQYAKDTGGRWLPSGAWDACRTDDRIRPGADVVLGFDGSYRDDSTALVVGTVSPTPLFDVVKVWSAPPGDDDWRVPIADVEQTIRDACKRWRVVEIVCDPYRWARTMQVLDAEGLPVVEFAWQPKRITPATTDLYRAILGREISHTGHPVLKQHMEGAVIVSDGNGSRIAKEGRHSKNKIDAAAALLMCHSRATWRSRKKTRRTRSFAA